MIEYDFYKLPRTTSREVYYILRRWLRETDHKVTKRFEEAADQWQKAYEDMVIYGQSRVLIDSDGHARHISVAHTTVPVWSE